jgi:membrane protease YdiL (CAAX protease family)
MATINVFTKSNPVISYFVLVLVISWGGMSLVAGPRIFGGTSWQTDPLFQLAILVMLAGPPVAGLVMTVLVTGKNGLRELFSRLLKWRVGARWYAVALLTAPLVQAAVLFALSLTSSVFLPTIVTAEEKIPLLLSGILVGLVGALLEEMGWTGFAIPRLRLRHSILMTGVIVGVVWGVWHLLQMAWVGSSSSEAIPLASFLFQFFFCAIAQLTAYRVLMVWVYDHTESLFLAVLMHASYIFSTLFVLAPPTTGAAFLTYTWLFTALLWVVVAGVALANRRHLSQQPAAGTLVREP